MGVNMLSLRATTPYSIPQWGKYLFMFTFPCWLALAIVGLPGVGPGYPVYFEGALTRFDAPMSLLVDAETVEVFTAMSVLVVVANPFLALLTWFVVPLNCLSRREDGYLRGGIAIGCYVFLNVVMVIVVILGERVASAKPAFEELLNRFPDLTLAEAQRSYNTRIYELRVGLAINLSFCLVVALAHVALICLLTLTPSSMKVPRRYEPTIQNWAVKKRPEEEVPLLSSVTDNSNLFSGPIEDLFQLHEARWMQSRRREETAIHESASTNQTADDGAGDTEENNVGHMAENTYTDNTADDTPGGTSGENTVVSSLPQFESYQSFLMGSLPSKIWISEWVILMMVLPNTFVDILLMSFAFASRSCDGQCIIETTGTYPWLLTYLLGFELLRRYRKQKQKFWAMSMLTNVTLVAHCLAYIYGFAAYVLLWVNLLRRGVSHLGIPTEGTSAIEFVALPIYAIKLPWEGAIFFMFLFNVLGYVTIYPQGPL
ncbi:hypothetical protein F5Y01DRAFT_296667 [Xylaria sp. FL0043]|nr:hypothetical protein F5Y01DRAFT_296667 [Xylaria sp. FL0043]